MRGWRIALPGALLVASQACALAGGPPASPPPSAGPSPTGWTETGEASWYGRPFHGRFTASGEVYDMNDLTAAHPSLPFGTRIRVENLDNGRSVVVRVNDRGPFVEDRVLDLSRKAAEELGMIGPGTARVRITVVEVPPPRTLRESNPFWLESVQVEGATLYLGAS